MANASRDQNFVTTLMGVDFTDMDTPALIAVDTANGRLLVSAIVTSSPSPQALKTTVSGSITYLANAPAGTAQASALWRAMKIDETTGSVITWADGNTDYDNVATDLTTLTYS